jgi:hypothetical protein
MAYRFLGGCLNGWETTAQAITDGGGGKEGSGDQCSALEADAWNEEKTLFAVPLLVRSADR